jgi:hypothetical protein
LHIARNCSRNAELRWPFRVPKLFQEIRVSAAWKNGLKFRELLSALGPYSIIFIFHIFARRTRRKN